MDDRAEVISEQQINEFKDSGILILNHSPFKIRIIQENPDIRFLRQEYAQGNYRSILPEIFQKLWIPPLIAQSVLRTFGK